MKTVFVLTLGWLLFDSQLSLKNILGMVLAIIGMVVYSWAVELEKKTHARILSKTSLTEEEIRLLREGIEDSSTKEDVELGDSKA